MSSSVIHLRVNRNHQAGYLTVIIVSIIALLALFASRSATIVSTDIIESAGAEVRSAEAFYAAETVLVEALEWLSSNTPTYTDNVSSTRVGTSVVVSNGLAGAAIDRTYTTSYWYFQSGDNVRVFARAVGPDGKSSSILSQWTATQSTVAAAALKQPLGLEGGLSNVTGTPDITAIGASGSSIPAGNYTLRVGDGEEGGSYGNLNSTNGEAITEGTWASGDTDIWDDYFDLTRAEMQALASSNDSVYWFGSGERPSGDLGSATEPVIVIMNDCSSSNKITGQKEFIGIVFIDQSSCALQGWSMKVKGSFAVNGDVTKLNSNTYLEAHYVTSGDSAMSPAADSFDLTVFPSNLVALPGTWTDTEAN